jgi:hypothetical protein
LALGVVPNAGFDADADADADVGRSRYAEKQHSTFRLTN